MTTLGSAARTDPSVAELASAADARAAPLASAGRSRSGVRSRAEPRSGVMVGGVDVRLARLVALAAIVFSALYFLSDVIELAQGGFSDGQLWLTFVAEAVLPLIVIGLYVVQRPRIGVLGRRSAIAYACVYVFFTYTVLYALVAGTPDFAALSHDLRPWMTIGGAIMVLAGGGFGLAVLRAEVLPGWTAVALIAGVILVSASSTLPDGVQLVAAGIRDLGFAAMGVAVLRLAALPDGRTTMTAEQLP